MTKNLPSKYSSSNLDIERLRKYARRVARETQRVPIAQIGYEREVSTLVPAPGVIARIMGKTVHRPSIEHIELVGAHWPLETWDHRIKTEQRRGRSGREELYHNRQVLLLNSAGDLMEISITTEETILFGERYHRTLEASGRVQSATPETIMKMDHRKEYREGRGSGGVHYYGDARNLSPLPVRHAKGVGASLALKALLEP